MSGHTRRHALQPWVLSVAILALIAGPILLYKILPLAGLSAEALPPSRLKEMKKFDLTALRRAYEGLAPTR
jgi:hypothetical protein